MTVHNDRFPAGIAFGRFLSFPSIPAQAVAVMAAACRETSQARAAVTLDVPEDTEAAGS